MTNSLIGKIHLLNKNYKQRVSLIAYNKLAKAF
jgi:hypothetical protein